MSNLQNNKTDITMANPLNQQFRGGYEDRPAVASNRQLSDEEKWRLQEEQWAIAEQARYGSSASGLANNNSGLGYIRSMSDSEMAVPFNSPAGTASNNNSIRNHPNLMADDMAPMDAERFGKLRNYYDRSGQGNTMANDLANIQHREPSQPQQFGYQPLATNDQQLPQQQPIPDQLQQVYNDDQKHFEQDKQIHEHALLEELNDPARLHHQQLQQQQHQIKSTTLQEEQQPLLPHQVPDQQFQDQPLSHYQQKQRSPLREDQLKDHNQLPPLLQQEQQNNFVDPNLDLNAAEAADGGATQNSYYGNNSTLNKTSITSGNASTRSLVKEDGIAPYDGQAQQNIIGIDKDREIAAETMSPSAITPAAIVAKTIQANHNFDEQFIAEHGEIMTAEGERYNAVAESIGIPSRINDDLQKDGSEYGSPTAFLDDALILEEKAKQAELERRIAERNKVYEERMKQDEIKQERSRELGLAGVGAGAGPATKQQRQSETYDRIVNEPWDENATGDNFVAMGKPRSNNNSESPSAIRARELQQQQSAGISEAEAKNKDHNQPKMADAIKAQLNMPARINPEDGIMLGAQTYTGQPPKPIEPIHEDIPDIWLERYRQDTQERRAKKETQRRLELNRRAEEKGGFANKIAAVFDDTKASFKKSKQESELKAEDKKLANNNHRAKERMSKYFPMHTSERFVCAFDAQALHHHMPFAGHVILTDRTLCFVGKGYEDAELAANDATVASAPSSYNNRLSNNSSLVNEKKDVHAAGHAHKKEHILIKEAIPLANIASIAMGSVVKNNGLVFVLDASDAIVVADAIQLFTTDGRIFQFKSFSHPCVTKKGKSYDGRTVPALNRFLNYLDHQWRGIGGDRTYQQYQQQQLPLQSNIPARE